jgi:hypothetical protein
MRPISQHRVTLRAISSQEFLLRQIGEFIQSELKPILLFVMRVYQVKILIKRTKAILIVVDRFVRLIILC